MRPALLALEDGTVFRGFSCGADGDATGELVFNTSMTGYQEVLTDPSYKGQLVAMTYPHIGNYGINPQDDESSQPHLEGFIVRELCQTPSNWRSTESLGHFLKRHNVPAIEGIDTRALTRILREKGSLRAILSSRCQSPRRLVAAARRLPRMSGRNLAESVSCAKAYSWSRTGGLHVVVLDFGVKRGILRCLEELGCRVSVVPAGTKASDILALRPDGALLSNGPGDPEPLQQAADTARGLLAARLPLFGICLGHQILGLALGGRTFKLKFGHHGANHPVMDLLTRRVEITVQNHGFCVDPDSLPRAVACTHVNLNDRTCEGLAHRRLPAFSVQYHPEASAGPHDSRYLFERFRDLMLASRAGAKRRPYAQAL
ncbi:MAG TPA: carbamoyl phosphate synthase small subunit [Elusimicrobia bacterium]|nr:carbamoyl phosphate synthase small subunit [Elusimicrobiota bacterium]HBT61097.1 carbamoyl phosphate synthase small subunit [Elusimicrobiota bacterium]